MPPSCCFALIFFTVTLSCVGEVKSGNKKALRDRLLKDYDSSVVPPEINNSSMVYYVVITSITEVVERQGYITCGIVFGKIWTDTRLVWNYTIEDVHRVYFKNDSLWKPNPLFFYNRVENEAPLIADWLNADFQGGVTWYKSTELRTVCTFDLSQFPFDRQECHIIFGSRIDENDVAKDKHIGFLSPQVKSRWRAVEARATARRQNHFGEEIKLVDTKIILERRAALVSTSIICPLLFNVIVSLLPFWMTSSTRLALGGANLYLGTAILWKLEELLPLDGYTKPFLAHYCVLALAVSLLSLVYGVVRCSLTKRAPVAFLMTFVSKVTRPLPALFCLPSTTAAKDTATEDCGLASFPNPESGSISWSDTLMVIDKLAFAVCSLVYFVATVTLVATLSATPVK